MAFNNVIMHDGGGSGNGASGMNNLTTAQVKAWVSNITDAIDSFSNDLDTIAAKANSDAQSIKSLTMSADKTVSDQWARYGIVCYQINQKLKGFANKFNAGANAFVTDIEKINEQTVAAMERETDVLDDLFAKYNNN